MFGKNSEQCCSVVYQGGTLDLAFTTIAEMETWITGLQFYTQKALGIKPGGLGVAGAAMAGGAGQEKPGDSINTELESYYQDLWMSVD